MATAQKESVILTDGYIYLWKQKYPNAGPPNFNRNKAHFGWTTMRKDMSMDEIKELVEFFFTIPDAKQHDLSNFHWNYDQVVERFTSVKKDRAHRKVLAKQSEQRVKEHEERLARIKDDQRSSDQ
jgi:predicted DNA-binding ArsR family transcriptional regulator